LSDWTETRQERLDFADFVETLSPSEWDSVVPEDGYRVRDVVAHVIQGATQSTRSTIVGLAGYGFRYNAYYDAKARQGGAADPTDLVARLRAAAPSQQRLLGLFGPKPAAMLAETLAHHQDVRRRLDSPRIVPPSRLVMLLDAAKTAGFPVGVKKRIAGLELRATDVDWRWGNGPEVRGPAEALFYAMVKNRRLRDELEGEGVEVLTARL
jgi:uncharacterized protein (TIGR03083 family)